VVTFEDHDASIPAPGRRLNDVASTRLTHGSHRVAVRVRFVDLRRVGDVQGLLVPMVTDEGVRRYLQLVAHPRRWSGETSLFNGGFGEVPCRGVRHSIDYRRNVMRASFPRHCASSPRWVKFRAVSYAQARRFYADDALSDDPVISETENDLAWSGRVRHQPSS
jgi:hypothetical protein